MTSQNTRKEPATWGAIFDVDGTMVDNTGYHVAAWMEFGRRNGMPITEEYYRNSIHSRWDGAIEANLRADFGTRADRPNLAREKAVIYRELYRPALEPMPGLLPWLNKLRERGIPCAVASNAFRENVDLVCVGLGITDLFQTILTPDAGLAGKPAPDMFEAAAVALGQPVERCLVFEDSPSGFGAAEAAGAPYIRITGASPMHGDSEGGRALACHRDFTTLSVGEVERGLPLDPA